MYLMLVRNGSPVLYAGLLIAVVLAGLLGQLSLGVLSVVPRLRSDLTRIQIIDVTGALSRIVLIASHLLFMNAGLAVLIATAVLFFNN